MIGNGTPAGVYAGRFGHGVRFIDSAVCLYEGVKSLGGLRGYSFL